MEERKESAKKLDTPEWHGKEKDTFYCVVFDQGWQRQSLGNNVTIKSHWISVDVILLKKRKYLGSLGI